MLVLRVTDRKSLFLGASGIKIYKYININKKGWKFDKTMTTAVLSAAAVCFGPFV